MTKRNVYDRIIGRIYELKTLIELHEGEELPQWILDKVQEMYDLIER